jgi:transglutaminase-like putative cysteine protease
MNTTRPLQHSFIMLRRQIVIVLLICYFPHITTEPWWLFVIFSTAIAYRIMVDYFNYSNVSRWKRLIFLLGCLSLLYGNMFTSGFFIRCLLTFIMLRILDISSVRDLKVLIICNFLLIFSALIVVQELWILIYLFVAVMANFSIMLKFSASQAPIRVVLIKTCQQLLLAIPLTILLFYCFPRVAPFWSVQALSKNTTGFSDSMSPGSISDLFNDNSTVMQITFRNGPAFNARWRGVTFSFYDGDTWNQTWYHYNNFLQLHDLRTNETADYDIIMEPNQMKWLFFLGYPVVGEPNLMFSPDHGLIRQNKKPVSQRFAYSLKVGRTPYHVLNRNEYSVDTQLPNNIDPRLKAWSKTQFAKSHNDIDTFIAFIHHYINQQNFWYTLSPPLLSNDSNQMDKFWFDTQKGFCEHYASAVTVILREVGIPARVVLGYQGGQWNPVSNSMTIKQSDAHAWVEYWQEGLGWRQLDPTAFIAPERIDTTIKQRVNDENQDNQTLLDDSDFMRKFSIYTESLEFLYDRWILFYNQSTQQTLLKDVGLGHWQKEQLLQASIGLMVLFFITIELFYRLWQIRKLDALLREYHLLQKEFRRFNITTPPSATLKQQCRSLIDKVPILTPILSTFIDSYEQLRLKQMITDVKENKKRTIALFKSLRLTLRNRKPQW